ncbi:hypothetical protein WME91_51925 [Sorangium sp. So ce269]
MKPKLTQELADELKPLLDEGYTVRRLRDYLRETHGIDISHGTGCAWRAKILNEEAFVSRASSEDTAERAYRDRISAEAVRSALELEAARDAALDLDQLEERRRLYASRADEVWASSRARRG